MGGAKAGQLFDAAVLTGCDGATGCTFGSRRDGNRPNPVYPVLAVQESVVDGAVCAYADVAEIANTSTNGDMRCVI